MFSRSTILALRPVAAKLDTCTRQLIQSLRLPRRGCRAGLHVQQHRTTTADRVNSVNGSIAIITGRRSAPPSGTNVQIYHG